MEDVTEEGYDLQFGTNVLGTYEQRGLASACWLVTDVSAGHYYFTRLLIPVLLKTAKASVEGQVRVVHVASVGHEFVGGIDFNTLKDGSKRRRWHTTKLYFQSKFVSQWPCIAVSSLYSSSCLCQGNIVVANEFHRQYANQGLVSLSLHPGNLKFDTKRHPSWPIRLLGLLVCRPGQNSSEFNVT